MDPNSGAVLQLFTVPTGSYPNGVAVDSAGSVYASDTVQNSVYMWAANGTLLNIFAFGPNAEPFLYPRGLAVDNNFNIYVTDGGNNRIVVLQKSGGGSNGAASVLRQSALQWAVLVAAMCVLAVLL